MRGRITVSLKNVQKSLTSSIGAMESIKSDVNVANVYSASTLWKQILRQLVSVAFCWDQNFTLSPITTRVGLGLCRLELRNSVVFVFL